MDDVDVRHLRRCLELARLARDGGNEPFGSLLVDGDGDVVAELMNTVGAGDITGHPELALGGVCLASHDVSRACGGDALHEL